MAHKEKVGVKGELRIRVVNEETGEVKVDKVIPNLIVDNGLAFITSRMIGTADNIIAGMAIGTSNTTPTDAQTALIGESARVALDAAATRVQTSVSNDTVQYIATFPPGTPGSNITVEEAGLFNNASSGGTMLARTLTGTTTKNTTDSLQITWKVQIQ